MRPAVGLALLLAACSPSASGAPSPKADNKIECAVGGAGSFSRDCTLDVVERNGVHLLIVRHANGSFRRFEFRNGSLTAADGSEATQVTLPERENVMDVAVGSDRYRITIKYDDPNF